MREEPESVYQGVGHVMPDFNRPVARSAEPKPANCLPWCPEWAQEVNGVETQVLSI